MDIANSLIYPTIDRASYIDFTNPIISTKYTMMLPYPRENNRLGAVIRPFTEEVRENALSNAAEGKLAV